MIPALRTAVAGQRILAADFNSNFDAVRTALNARGLFTDVSRTIAAAQTFTGAVTFTGPLSLGAATITGLPDFARRDVQNIFTQLGRYDAGGMALAVGPGALDHAGVGIFARSAQPNVRSAFIGVASPASTALDLVNEMSGPIRLIAGGTTIQATGTGLWADRYNAADGTLLLRRVPEYAILHDPQGRQAIFCGGVADPATYLDSGATVFRTRAASEQALLSSTASAVWLRMRRTPGGPVAGSVYGDGDGWGLLHRDATWAWRTSAAGALTVLQRAEVHTWSTADFAERMALRASQLDVGVPIGAPLLRAEDTRSEAPAVAPPLAGVLRPAFKQSDAIGLTPFGEPIFYVQLVTRSLWNDDSGGGIHDTAYADDGQIYVRYRRRVGPAGAWRRVVTEPATWGAPTPPPAGQLAAPTLSASVTITASQVIVDFSVTPGANWPGGVPLDGEEALDGGPASPITAALTFQRQYARGVLSQTAAVRVRGLTAGALTTSDWSNTAPVLIPPLDGGNPTNVTPGD